MEISIKYSVGDKVWLIHENLVKEAIVKSISLDAFENNINHPIEGYIRYELKNDLGQLDYTAQKGGHKFHQNKLFPSKEELLKSL